VSPLDKASLGLRVLQLIHGDEFDDLVERASTALRNRDVRLNHDDGECARFNRITRLLASGEVRV